MSFNALGLEPRVLRGVEAMGYTSPTPIQQEAIPHVLAGRDVVGCAQTGTGKTAAFVLPTLSRIPTKSGIRALVVTPTRELALQIDEVARAASRFSGHRSTVVHGGVGYNPQLSQLRRGVEVLVACPGRLLDLQARGVLELGTVDVLILDEADRMLDMGFWPDVRRIIALLPQKRQNLLFSATMSPEVLKVVASTLDNPVRIDTAPTTTPVERIEQAVYPVGHTQKTPLLVEMLKRDDHDRVLVFTRTKHRADRLARQLDRQGISSGAIHGGRSQPQRQRALASFKRGSVRVLVATDVASRGIDVDRISHVINYDMPGTPEDYVHRIGRTARAGAEGTAASFMAPEEFDNLKDIERTTGAVIPCADLEGFSYGDRLVPNPQRTAVPATKGGSNGQKQGQGKNRRGRQGSRKRQGRVQSRQQNSGQSKAG